MGTRARKKLAAGDVMEADCAVLVGDPPLIHRVRRKLAIVLVGGKGTRVSRPTREMPIERTVWPIILDDGRVALFYVTTVKNPLRHVSSFFDVWFRRVA